MARRLLDTPFFQAEKMIGKVYYEHDAGMGRRTGMEYFKGQKLIAG
jgi:hypothetical protein